MNSVNSDKAPDRLKYYTFPYINYSSILRPEDSRRKIDPFLVGAKLQLPPLTSTKLSSYTKNSAAL